MERDYGLVNVPERYEIMVTEWKEELKVDEQDEDVRIYAEYLLEELANPQDSRLTCETDNLDSIEDYFVNRLQAYDIKLEEDKVYQWLLIFKDYFKIVEAFEICHNIDKAIDYMHEWQEEIEKSYAKYKTKTQ